MNEEKIGQRIEEVIEYLKLNKRTFALSIGFSPTVIGRIINDDDRAPSYSVLYAIAEKYPNISMDWMITGLGEMDKGAVQSAAYIQYYKTSNPGEISGVLSGNLKPDGVFRIAGYEDCQYAFDVVGDAMSPRFNTGDVVFCRWAEKDMLIPGATYLVVTKGQQMIRNLKDVIADGGFVFAAMNPEYSDMVIQSHDILNLLQIKGKIVKTAY